VLRHIHIQNFAIVENLELELHSGMCVITGETGAGKSIVVDALGLVLGDRADSGVVRQDADKAEVSIWVEISEFPGIKQWLSEQELDGTDDDCILRRVVTRDGRSRAYINNSPASISVLRSLGQQLVDIHGQHEHQSLLRREIQRNLLDTHGANEKTLEQLENVYHEWRSIKQKFETAIAGAQERKARIELLRYQVQELSELGLNEHEIPALEQEQQRLANVDRLQQVSRKIYLTLYESDEQAVYSVLSHLISELNELCHLDDRLTEWLELLSEAHLDISEAAKGLRRYSDTGLDLDPQRLEWVESRLARIHDLARKYRVSAEELPKHLAALESSLQSLEDPEFDTDALRERVDKLEECYRRLANEIHTARQEAAITLSQQTSAAMQQLGMKGGIFKITVERADELPWTPHGIDRIEFMVSANPGQPLKPLAKVASGGELSRISLALQMVAAETLALPTLIFDEVDSGIGGGVAEVVGRQLHKLGKHRQVLCVTHLPQVAAQAHYHYQVTKRQHQSTTLTEIIPLTQQGRVDEIARMLGGLELTKRTREHAQEMINRAQSQ
jgi:DNA repair protein RecN (Recombination protein N)